MRELLEARDKQKCNPKAKANRMDVQTHFPSVAVLGLHRSVTAYQARRRGDGGGRQRAKTPQDAQVELAVC